MHSVIPLLVLLGICIPPPRVAELELNPAGSRCLLCHSGIESIRDPESRTMQRIYSKGRRMGDTAGCVVCHGGNPTATEAEAAHGGDELDRFFPDPGSPWVNHRTCGPCHMKHVGAQRNSLMMTSAGEIQGATWAFGALEGYDHKWATGPAVNPHSSGMRWGTGTYRRYMDRLRSLEPNAFPSALEVLPSAPDRQRLITADPGLAAFTYARAECLRCHLSVQGRSGRGDYRGMGCSACHIPYSNEGYYEGHDPVVNRQERNHPLVHTIQSTHDAKVTVGDVEYSGIPVETCATCHYESKRIGVSYQGLMEVQPGAAVPSEATDRPKVHGRSYMAMPADVHASLGMVCGDCHTTIDVHGDGFIAGSSLGQVEIECTDCHGTTYAYPWQLPAGFGDEFSLQPASGVRGTAKELYEPVSQGGEYPVNDGYLLTARGNPIPEVTRSGREVRVLTAQGRTLSLKPLKLLRDSGELGPQGRAAMHEIRQHTRRMECYSCHSAWAPQCYGCHVEVDYSEGKQSRDWVASGHWHDQMGNRSVAGEASAEAFIPGKCYETQAYTRWEEPALVRGGEGRITPAIPGCQVTATIIGQDGSTIVKDHAFRTAVGDEGGGAEPQATADFTPANPHTTGRARPCASCHLSPKALGYGTTPGAELDTEPLVVDLRAPSGEILSGRARTHMGALDMPLASLSGFVAEDGRQLMTVGHHFRLSRPLSGRERRNMDRVGTCLACHEDTPILAIGPRVLHDAIGLIKEGPLSTKAHSGLLRLMFHSAGWIVVGVLLLPLLLAIRARRRQKRRRRRDVPRRAVATPEATSGPVFYPPRPPR